MPAFKDIGKLAQLLFPRGEDMESKKTPIRSKDSKDALQPVGLCPVDSDDCFELANEPDEFGVHVPSHSAEK